MRIDRRRLIGLAAASAFASPLLAQPRADRPRRAPTPPQEMGPFYPIVDSAESEADLTRAGAAGDHIALVGRVLRASGEPVGSAMVLVWQADAGGYYGHPRDARPGTRDPRFNGHCLLRTQRDGSFRVTTVRPGAYPDMPGTWRTPHIHFEVIGESDRLTTQMYFPGEPLNERDRLLRTLRQQGGDPASLIARDAGRDGSVARLEWDVVLPAG